MPDRHSKFKSFKTREGSLVDEAPTADAGLLPKPRRRIEISDSCGGDLVHEASAFQFPITH